MSDHKHLPYLRIKGEQAGSIKRIQITKPRFTIGREANNDLQIANLSVSRYHAEIRQTEDRRYLLIDIKCKYGAWINGTRITEHVLADGDEITLAYQSPMVLGFEFSSPLGSADEMKKTITHQLEAGADESSPAAERSEVKPLDPTFSLISYLLHVSLTCLLLLAVVTEAAAQGAQAVDKLSSPPDAKPESEWPGLLSRWIEAQQATLSLGYRFVDNSRGRATTNLLEYQEAFKARLKFDVRGRYSLQAGLSTGSKFTSGYNNTGVGTGREATNVYLKQLFFAAEPIKGVEFQFGGLSLLRGESSEITSYDNDGYLMGERLRLKRPKNLFFDEIAVTYGYLGDLDHPSVMKRFHRVKQSNYHQFLATKKIGQRLAVSADYTFHNSAETLRQAIKVDTSGLRALDSFRFENYQRLDVNQAYGFAVSGEKQLSQRFTLGGGYAQIDRRYGGLNASRFGHGNRLYLTSKFVLSPEFSVSTFVARAVNITHPATNRTRVEVVFSYNLLPGLKRSGLF